MALAVSALFPFTSSAGSNVLSAFYAVVYVCMSKLCQFACVRACVCVCVRARARVRGYVRALCVCVHIGYIYTYIGLY